jgi:hypothetical protein
VKSSRRAYWLPAALIFLFSFSFFAVAQPVKSIRLRNETIVTTTNLAPAPSALRNQPGPGLFLIQFHGHLQPAWRDELKAMGVGLLQYVPEDAFIAGIESGSPDRARALSFVRYVGPYLPAHKIHPKLAIAANKALQTNNAITVNVLISPRAGARELAGVRALLSSIHQESHLRQGTVLRGTLPPGRLNALAQSGAVLWIEQAPKRKLVDEAASKIVGGDDGAFGTPTTTQQLGFAGTNVVVAIADTGLDTGDTNTMHVDLRGRVKSLLYYGNLADASDEHSHGTHVAGIVAGNAATGEVDAGGSLYGLGVASQASLVIQRIFDADGNEVNPPPSDETLTHDAVRAGAKIGSNSWGSDVQGDYDIDCAAFDELVRDADASTPGDQPYILEFSAGNAGPDSQTMDSPAAAKNVIATGASENGGQLDFGLYDDGPDTMADFSSRGPCADGRIKPDVVAPGTFIASLLSSAASDQFAWLPIDNNYIYMGGTSQAGPHASGAAAVFVQYYKSLHTNAVPSPALVKGALINSAMELDESNGGPGPIPNNDEGWGRLNLANIIGSPRSYEFVDQSTLLATGQIFEHHTFVQSSSEPLKITLAYTDVPGFPGAVPALVNDLDLEVIGPDGTLYRGNQFNSGESVPNAITTDNINNVEAVHLAQPLPGDYLVRVRARNVPQDARLDTQAIDQDFALVISGDFPKPRGGIVLFDRDEYTAPGVVKIEVLDAARAASNTVSVLLKSTTEPGGENYLLHASGNYGAFTGSVATVVGTAAVDGKLEIHGGDVIEADYIDAGGTNRATTAAVRLAPPVLTGVTASLDLGVMTITWQTDEPGNSIVRYSTNLTFNLAATNSLITTNHVVKLVNLIPGKTYHFLVSSSDDAGNAATNNNSGAFFSFVAVQTPTVLLVDAYEPDDSSPTIDDGSYTNALAATGLSYSFWKVTDRGSPQLSDLKPFQAVIWRVTDGIYYDGTNNTLSAGQQVMIQNYLNDGGSFLMASMGILSQLGDVPFRRNVLQVGGFKLNDNPYYPCTDCDEQFGVPAIQGADNDPTTTGINVTLDYSSYANIDLGDGTILGPDFSDTFTPNTNAAPIVYEAASGKVCGMKFPRTGQDSPGRVVFLSFPLDTVPTNGIAPNNETIFLRNLLNFLVPGANGVGRIALDSGFYTIPSRVTVEVGDSDLAGLGQTQVTFSASSRTNQVVITLNETPHPGLFRGFITLVSTNAPGTNQLRVLNGDLVTAKYFDSSAGSNVISTATVDTVPPVISNIVAVPNYSDATVSWTTSKPADSLVQFGESKLLGRTAYLEVLKTNRAVTLTGLSANRNYYYQVTSRDDAGNAITDDNHGNFYTFQTLRALQPPWTDTLDNGVPNWTVVPGSGTEVNWTLGIPANGRETNAYSPPDAWGSNLKGISIGQADTSLYSPVLDLSGASKVTLTFWDSYDFNSQNSILEAGEVLIITNSASAPATLVQIIGETSSGWQQESIDLTPYAGQTVQLVWHYVAVSLGGNGPTAGWLVDNVTVDVPNPATVGTIVISKNLSQGSFTLSGPLNQSGQGLVTTVSNAPPGDYIVHFSDVPFYQTPENQTNTLPPSGSLLFLGGYTFTDTNHNNISDAWEQYYFGSASTNRTQSTDSDHDGMTDYAEFIAGTNPTNATSKLIFLPSTVQTDGFVKLQWAAIPGRAYQVLNSTNLSTWSPVTDWLQASGSPMSYLTTNVSRGPHLYRVQVRP